MTPSKKLYELIHSLTKAEKRSFKLLCASKSGQDSKNYMRLFDAIDAMDSYDEAKLREQFKGEKFLDQFTATKYYLYNIVLKTLIHTKSMSQTYLQVSNLESVSLLFEKKLYEHILGMVKIIKQKSLEFENYPVVLECINWEQKTLNHLPLFEKAYEFQENLAGEKEKVIRLYENQSIYQNLKFKVFALVKNDRFFLSKGTFIKFQSEFESIHKGNPPKGKKALADYFYTRATIEYYNNDFENSKKNYGTILDLLNKHPFLFKEPHNMNLLNSAQNYLVAAIQSNSFGKYESSLIERLKKNERKNVSGFLMIVRLELSYYIKTEEYDDAISLIEENARYEKELAKNDFYVVYGFMYDAILAYFWKKDYKSALKKLVRITTFNDKALPFDLLISIRIIEVLIHYKLNNLELVVLYLRNLNKVMKTRKSELFINQRFFKLLIDDMKVESRKTRTELLLEMDSAESNKMAISLSNYFDIKKWVKQSLLN